MESFIGNSDEYRSAVGIDGMAEVIALPKKDTANRVVHELASYFYYNHPSMMDEGLEAAYNTQQADAELQTPFNQAVDCNQGIQVEKIATWQIHPNLPTSYALATKFSPDCCLAKFLKVDTSGSSEADTAKELFSMELNSFDDPTQILDIERLANSIEQDELEILSALVDKIHKLDSEDDLTQNSDTVLFELFGERVEDILPNQDPENSLEVEAPRVLETVFDDDLTRDARKVLREEFGYKHAGDQRVAYQYIDDDGTEYYINIRGERKNRRDHNIVDLRLFAQNEVGFDRIDYLDPEKFDSGWLTDRMDKVRQLLSEGEKIDAQVFDMVWDNPGEYSVRRQDDL